MVEPKEPQQTEDYITAHPSESSDATEIHAEKEPVREIDTEEGRQAMVLRRAEDLCRRGKVPKHCWPNIFDQHLEEYHYFIKFGNKNDKTE